MTTTSPEDAAALFGLPPEPASPEPATEAADAAEAAEAALAAELAATIESGGVAADAPDSRAALRVDVAWPARMQLPDGRVIELQLRNVSQGGVGLVSHEDFPARTVVNFEMDVPPLDTGGEITVVRGPIKTTYTVARDSEILGGGTWEAPPAGLELVNAWIKQLWR
jgi:hypothetical protein